MLTLEPTTHRSEKLTRILGEDIKMVTDATALMFIDFFVSLFTPKKG